MDREEAIERMKLVGAYSWHIKEIEKAKAEAAKEIIDTWGEKETTISGIKGKDDE